MCSYTSLSSDGGCLDSDSGGYGVDSTYSKKVRKQKVPKRGPGVAELEKILREQEKKDTSLDKSKNIEGFSVISQLSSSYKKQSPILPSQKSQPKNLPFSPDPLTPSSTTPSSTTFCGHFRNNTSLPACREGNGGPGLVMHEHGFSPSMWNSWHPNVDIGGPRLEPNGPSQLFPSPSMTQRRQHSPTSKINFFPQFVSSCSSTTPSSDIIYQDIELPPNQISNHHYNSVSSEEDKMVGTKRPFPFFTETPIPHHYRVPSFSPQLSRQDNSFSRGSHDTTNLEQVEAFPRDEKMGRERNTDYGVAKGNFLLFGSPTIPSASTHISHREQSKLKHPLSSQERIEDSQHRPGPESGSIGNKSSLSFLLQLEQESKVETNFSLINDETVETKGDDLDLDLRL